MTQVTSTYNFVPLSNEVFTPHWADQISHDIPFSDGESGTIRLKITAKSDIFVRNAALPSDTQKESDFNQLEGKYFIPGSSIKGAIRSVMQILSFSKIDPLSDVRYAVRDLQNKEIYREKVKWTQEVCGGWLYKKGDDYYIESAGVPGRVSHHELDNFFGLSNARENVSTIFQGKTGKYLRNKEHHKSSSYKYALLNSLGIDHKQTYNFNYERDDVMREIYTITSQKTNGSQQGKLVFTGQPGPRVAPKGKRASGKFYEFVFWEVASEPQLVPEQIIEDFKFIYYDHDKGKQSTDYKEFSQKLEKKEKIPVFFCKGEKGEILHLGLSYMYKLPYDHRVKECLPPKHNNKALDLNECVFGFVSEKDKQALKGRVQFSHAFNNNKAVLCDTTTAVLGSPMASYYPFYMEQKPNSNGRVTRYASYHDNGARIRGYKRYPFRTTPLVNQSADNSDVSTKFTPLAKGAEFTCDINVHNLRHIELGALLSALTFHANEGYYHGIGMAKPLGFGQCKVEVTDFQGFKKDKVHYLKAFELVMENETQDWLSSKPLVELFSMSQAPSEETDKNLTYPALSIKGSNDFVAYKRSKLALPRYSHLSTVSSKAPVSVLTGENQEAQILLAYLTEKNQKTQVNRVIESSEEKLTLALHKDIRIVYEKIRAELHAAQTKKEAEAIALKKREEEKQKELDRIEEEKQLALRRAEKEKHAISQGPVFKNDRPRRFKNDIENPVDIYLKKLHGNKYKKEKTPPYVLSEHFNLIKEVLKKFASNAKQRELNLLTSPEEHSFKALVSWVGEETAKAWLKEIFGIEDN